MKGIARMLASLRSEQKKSGSDYTGTVTMVKGSTAYVRFTGAEISDTPVSMSVDCKPGDKVRVRVVNGRAWLTGNDTKPPTNDTENIAEVKSENAALLARIGELEARLDASPDIVTGSTSAFTVDARATGGAIGTFGVEFIDPPALYLTLRTGSSSPDVGLITVSVTSVDSMGYSIAIHNAASASRYVMVQWLAIGKLKNRR